jgi:small subunit ribosomal protein S16
MSVKMRLQRHGRKKRPYFHIVVADSRSPRDGRFIERLGSYDPNANPAAIELNSDKALQWLHHGAQPTETVRRILSYKGVLYRKHLQRGVKKGALTQEQADQKYAEFLEKRSSQIQAKVDKLQSKADEMTRQRLDAEAKVAQKRADALKAAQGEAGATTSEEAAAQGDQASEGSQAAD